MELLCYRCDRSVVDNLFEYQKLREKNEKEIYLKYTFNNISLEEVDKMLNDYITTHNEKFDFYLISCDVVIQFDNNFTENIKTDSFCKRDIIIIKRNLLYNIYHIIPKIYIGSNVCNLKQMILNTFNDRCHMTYKFYKNLPMSMVERRMNINIAKNPSLINLLDRTKNHPLIRKYRYQM